MRCRLFDCLVTHHSSCDRKHRLLDYLGAQVPVLGDFQREFIMSSYIISSKERTASQDVVVDATEALKILFDLLESHAPLWYTKEHHEKSKNALHLGKKTTPWRTQRSKNSLDTGVPSDG